MVIMIDWWIIEKSLEGSLSRQEEERLQAWLAMSAEHVRFYERVKACRAEGMPGADYPAWREEFVRDLEARQRRRRIFRWRMWGSVAAVLALGIGMACWWWMKRDEVPQEAVYVAYQEPDRSKVHLVTATGEVLDLSATASLDTLEIDGQAVIRNATGLVYAPQDSCADDSCQRMNEVYVPRGAEFNLVLSDGSHVWLNSDSRLRYPSVFRGDVREVEVSGEVFFEVARDERSPFVVKVEGLEVVVLGTKFNVNTRVVERIQTTLVEGQVAVNLPAGQSVVLEPGEMASANVVSGEVRSKPVNVQKYVAWRYGRFCFEEATMEEIMRELALWYDVEVEYRNGALKSERFTGSLPRSESIMEILKKIEQTTYVHFHVAGNRIIIGN